ncbi:hypothetical protein PIIN_01637 [Serendipita indica DSM 11827]|uniref:Uncharacterized protein n=1 Tax=Serendipita indica (strain DSM 11827) TaxID=1109443 RepID=G4T930_SERID|nr:hypothetical protein PIIN_01637 [Serendipita indica DSM 11827]
MKGLLHLLVASLARRESPQEHSHHRYIVKVKQMLDLNNTIGVADPVFGLLTNDVASTGMGLITDPNCLQLAIADSAFSNSKRNNDLEGLVASLIYRALERNTAAVGLASEPCKSYVPVNKELETFKQHQDPAAPGAQANNKATVLELARQIMLLGGEPTDALYSGTFTAADLNGPAAGNSCNSNDCIFENNLLIRDASMAEIYDYVGNCMETVTSTVGINGSTPPTGINTVQTVTRTVTGTATQARTVTTSVPNPTFSSVSSSARASQSSSASSATQQQQSSQQQQPTTSTPTASQPQATQDSSTNYQKFTGQLFGIGAPAVTLDSSGIYRVDGVSAPFPDLKTAIGRSCSIQKNACANAANQQKQDVSQCDAQERQCNA